MPYGEQHGTYGSRFQVNGVDISAWQKDVHFDVLKDKIAFLGIRLGVGKNPDDYAEVNVAQANKFGIPWFGYYVPKVGQSNLDAQVQFLLDYMKYLNGAYGCGVVPPMGLFGDLERGGVYNIETMTKNIYGNWIDKFWPRVENAFEMEAGGFGCYTSYGFLDQYYPNDALKWRKLFVAQYNNNIALPDPLPRPWENIKVSRKRWYLWQWSADGNGLGSYYGVPPTGARSIDLVRYNGTPDDFAKDFGVAPKETPGLPVPPPEPEPLPDPTGEIGMVNTNGHTLWTHKRPDLLASTRNGYLPDKLMVVIENISADERFYKLGDNIFAYKDFIKLL
jgi:hypothetical protein